MKKDMYLKFEKHLLEDARPSAYFNGWLESGILTKESPFNMLSSLANIPQSPKYHPEGNVWNHTMMVVDQGALRKGESTGPKVFMWAALLHDIGKKPATKIKKGRITAYDHDRMGEKMAFDFLKELGCEYDFSIKVSKMVRWHMQLLFVLKELPFAHIEKMLDEVHLDEISLLALCDRLGRGNLENESIEKEYENIQNFKEICSKYQNLGKK